ncbi:hypothetical protein C8F01DRAFT_1252966 [Mycena amicta]|nr:hypothetical protein C8F01DRAFT_1252966 [Mycena amicta]
MFQCITGCLATTTTARCPPSAGARCSARCPPATQLLPARCALLPNPFHAPRQLRIRQPDGLILAATFATLLVVSDIYLQRARHIVVVDQPDQRHRIDASHRRPLTG